MIHVAYRETFELVGHGFSAEYLDKLPIALRRHYFRMYQDKLNAQAGQPTPQNDGKRVTYDPVKRGQ